LRQDSDAAELPTDPSAAGAPRGRRLEHLALAACVLIYGLLSIPVVLLAPGGGLDISWIQVLNRASVLRWQFGSDIVFTHGPLNVLAVPLVVPETFWLMIAFRLLYGGLMGWATFRIARRARAPLWAAPLALLIVVPILDAPDTIDPMFLVAPFAWLCLGLFFRDPDDSVMTYVFSTMVAAVALIKYTFFVVAVAVACLLAFDRVARQQRMPWWSFTFAAALLVFWVLAGQPLAGLLAWIGTGMEVSAGYSGAMSTPLQPGDATEVLGFCVGALLLLTVAGWIFVRHQERGIWSAVPLIGFALILFTHFKAGFVRHDIHAVNALLAMPAFGLAVWALCADALPRLRGLMVGGLLVILCLWCSAYGILHRMGWSSLVDYFTSFYNGAAVSLVSVSAPGELNEALVAVQANARAAVRAQDPLPAMSGTVDLYSYDQAVVLSHDLNYAPRPIFQSYTAFSDALARRNATSLESARPANVLLDAAVIDGRYPSTDDGRSWPVLLAGYDLAGVRGRFAHFVPAAQPRQAEMRLLAEATIALGQEITLPPHDVPLWAEIDTEHSAAGSMLDGIFKAPPLYAQVALADGGRAEFRIVPSVARGGLLLTPLITTGEGLAMLALGRPFPPTHEVLSIQLRSDGAWAYRPTVRIRLYTLAITAKPLAG